jgi:hypothetical protein
MSFIVALASAVTVFSLQCSKAGVQLGLRGAVIVVYR